MYDRLKKLLPAIVLLVLVLTYTLFDHIFVQCNWLRACDAMDAKNISRVLPPISGGTVCQDSNDARCLTNMGRILGVKEEELTIKNKLVADQEVIRNATQETVDRITKEQSDAAINSESAGAATSGSSTTTIADRLTKLNTTLQNQIAKLTALRADSESVRNEIINLRTQVSERYSKRMLWIFFSALYTLLSIAAILLSFTTINESLKTLQTNRPSLVVWLSSTTFFALAIACYVFFCAEDYLSMVGPMFLQSISSGKDVSISAISFFNAIGFFATIWLVSAGTAVYYSARSTDIADLEKLKKVTETHEKYLTYILYIGALMLFVGMLRLKIQFDWHLVFVSTDIKNSFYVLLENYTKSSIGAQAGFYSLVLAVIYLPARYVIEGLKEKNPGSAGVDENMGANLLQKLGLPFSSDFTTKFITIFSPILAGPIIDLFNLVLGPSVQG